MLPCRVINGNWRFVGPFHLYLHWQSVQTFRRIYSLHLWDSVNYLVVGNCLPINTVSCLRRPVVSSAALLQHNSSHYRVVLKHREMPVWSNISPNYTQPFARIPAIRNRIWPFQPIYIYIYIYTSLSPKLYSLCNLSCIRSCGPSLTSSPDGANQCFLLQVRLSSVFIKIIQQLQMLLRVLPDLHIFPLKTCFRIHLLCKM